MIKKSIQITVIPLLGLCILSGCTGSGQMMADKASRPYQKISEVPENGKVPDHNDLLSFLVENSAMTTAESILAHPAIITNNRMDNKNWSIVFGDGEDLYVISYENLPVFSSPRIRAEKISGNIVKRISMNFYDTEKATVIDVSIGEKTEQDTLKSMIEDWITLDSFELVRDLPEYFELSDLVNDEGITTYKWKRSNQKLPEEGGILLSQKRNIWI